MYVPDILLKVENAQNTNVSHCHTAIENPSDPIGYLLDFTNPYYTALAGNMKARAEKDNSF
jgi:hypothetical protein